MGMVLCIRCSTCHAQQKLIRLGMRRIKPTSFSLESEADIAMDMDTIIDFFKDDEYPWEEVLGQHNSDSDMNTDADEADRDSD